jgi:hypothetical protein
MIKLIGGPPERIPCRYCEHEISATARICFQCGRPQRWWKFHHLELASLLGVFVAFGLLILTIFQYRDAKRDRIDAAKALEQSNMALERASLAEAKLNRQRGEINHFAAKLFSSLCEISDGAFHGGTITCQLPDGTAIKYEPVFK